MIKKIFFSSCFLLSLIMQFSCGGENSTDPIEINQLIDMDGNIYQTVTIGGQEWMAENLKVTHYQNGDPIPNVTDNTEWKDSSTGAYCVYPNIDGYSDTYGYLYNWYAIADSRNIAPIGWHVPTDDEWRILIDYLGGHIDACNKLKEAGTEHWRSPNTGATNETGFTALPGGYRNDRGEYYNINNTAHFWSSTESDSIMAFHRDLHYQYSEVQHNDPKSFGFSIRCVRD